MNPTQKTESITIKLDKQEKCFISDEAKKKGISEEAYTKERALNGTGRLRFKDKERARAIVATQCACNELEQKINNKAKTAELIAALMSVQKGLGEICQY